jgi:hypothetical protein
MIYDNIPIYRHRKILPTKSDVEIAPINNSKVNQKLSVITKLEDPLPQEGKVLLNPFPSLPVLCRIQGNDPINSWF